MVTQPASTRSAILDAAQQLIQQHGVNGMSYQHIADAVGIRKASIHYHFATKNDLVEELVRRYNACFLGEVARVVDGDAPPPEKLRNYVNLFADTLCEDDADKVCLCGMLGAEFPSIRGTAADLVREFYRENARLVARVIEEGRTDGSLRVTGDPAATGTLVVSLVEGAMMTARVDGGVDHFRRIVAQLDSLLVS